MYMLAGQLNRAAAQRAPVRSRRACAAAGIRLCATTLLAGIVLATLTGAAATQQRYRYVNDQGVTVLDQSIPSKYLDRGYTILNSAGQVLKVVPSAADRKRLDEQQQVIDAEHKRKDRLAQSDQELLRMYSSAEDVERARDRKLESIRAAIALTDGNVLRLVAQKKSIENQGVQLERAGRTVSNEMVRNLKIVSSQIHDHQAELATRKAELERVRKTFDGNAQRLRELSGYPAGTSASPSAPGSANAPSH